MDQEHQPSPDMTTAKAGMSKTNLYVIAGIIVVVIGAAVYLLSPKTPADTDQQMGAPTPATTTNQAAVVASGASYKDGTYTAEGEYMVHAGPEKITITVTLKDGVITDSQFQGVPDLKMSQRYMDMFSQNYKQLIVGKNINEVNLGKVSGSSLTPVGFNAALTKIKAEAVSAS